MSLFLFLTVVQALVAAALVGVILMQRSEGGGLGIGGGGSPGGLMSARGAADFLTRATKWLAVSFVVLSIVMAAVAVKTTKGDDISSTLDRTVTTENDPLASQAGENPGGAVAETAAPAQTAPASDDPLADVTQ
jgi:preprotein translocase subunit SecG